MRVAVALLLVFVWTAFGRSPSLERISVAGSDYVRLAEWGEASGFSFKWNQKQGEVEMAGGSNVLHFTVDSRRAEIGQVTVWLSLPVVNRMGVALVSLEDARTTLEPILYPRKGEGPVETICIDPGHGGKDTGKAVGRNYEKKYTLLLARAVEDMLKNDGLKVVLTRSGDETVELGDRAEMAWRHGANLFVSLHYNAADDTGIRGVEVYCLAPAGMNSSNEGGGKSAQPSVEGNAGDERNVLLAYQMQKSITRRLPIEDRGMKRARFEVLREAHVPAVLIEGGFMTNPFDARNIYDATFRQRMARAIVEGILAYRRAVGGA
jgi:N-acetylmuramoyl-L-alanine amidase